MPLRIYLEYRDKKSEKFWEVSVTGKTVTRRWGKIGTKGQNKSEDMATPSAARTAADAMAEDKVRKGYALGHPDPAMNQHMVRARAIRQGLGGTDDLTLPFPPKPTKTSWPRYWDLYLEAREHERILTDFLGKPKLRAIEDIHREVPAFPTVEVDGLDQLSDIKVPTATRKILDQLDRLQRGNGVVFVEDAVDLATMLMMITHEKADQITEVRHRKWAPVTVNDLRRKRAKSLRHFKKLFKVDVPDFILELAHFIDSMWALGPFDDCLAEGLQETDYGIFQSVIEGKSPSRADLAGGARRHPVHPLNYFAIAQSERPTKGVLFDYESNAFAPYCFDCDIELAVIGSVWDCILEGMSDYDWLSFEIGKLGSFQKLNELLQEELDHYELVKWFYRLVTVGYLNFHSKPSMDAWGIDQIKFGNQIEVINKSYLDGLKESSLSRATISTNNFLPAYPVRIPQNFHPAFTDKAVTKLLWACRYFEEANVTEFIDAAQSSTSDLLGEIGFDGKIGIEEARAKKTFYRTIANFCESEVAAGRPYLAFFVALSLWDGTGDKAERSLSANLLEQVPDEICHPFLKLVAKMNIESPYD